MFVEHNSYIDEYGEVLVRNQSLPLSGVAIL